MTKLALKLDPAIREALDDTDLPWHIQKGKRHYQIRLDGKLIGILPYGKITFKSRDVKNVVANIHRTMRNRING